MVREKRRIRAPRIQKGVKFDEDDPDSYKDMPVPDKKSLQYTKDKIDEFHDQKIANLLARGVQMESDQEELDDEEEVMALDDSESEEEDEDEEEEEEHDEDEEDDEEEEEEGTDMESDLEGKRDEGLPDELAWGTRKKMFYDSDYVTAKGKSQEEMEAAEQEEEEEALKIQKRLAEHLSEDDYDLNIFQELTTEKKPAGKEERIVKDLKQMSQKEKTKLLKKESPELVELIGDFKAKMAELKDDMYPIMQRIKEPKVVPTNVANYLKMKWHLYLNYCTNISFYLVLKAKRIPAHNHTVIERLLTFRNLINELRPVDARMEPLLRSFMAGETVKFAGAGPKKEDLDKSKLEKVEDSASDLDEEAALRFYQEVEKRQKLKRKSKSGEEVEETQYEEEELDPEAKRGITYQMAKNKGLTPKRKKIDRNPRVKYREKFRRAKIRRKGQVREVRREEAKYSGELSGIRAGVKKSVKLK